MSWHQLNLISNRQAGFFLEVSCLPAAFRLSPVQAHTLLFLALLHVGFYRHGPRLDSVTSISDRLQGPATDELSSNDRHSTPPFPETIHHGQYDQLSNRGSLAQALRSNACVHATMHLFRTPMRNDGFGSDPIASPLLSLAIPAYSTWAKQS